jgi:hypothetical protein
VAGGDVMELPSSGVGDPVNIGPLRLHSREEQTNFSQNEQW